MEKSSYVYVIFRLDGSPCYVGKGKGRRHAYHRKHGRNIHLRRIYDDAGQELPIVKISENLSNDDACILEVWLIKAIGRSLNGGPLANQTDGGEGSVGWTPSLEWRARRSILTSLQMVGNKNTLGFHHTIESKNKMSVAQSGKVKSDDHKKAISEAHQGRKRSSEQCKAISRSLIGRTLSESHRASISAGSLGVTKSESTKTKMRESWKFRGPRPPIGDETRAKISVASSRPRKPLSEEHKAKLSILAKERLLKRRWINCRSPPKVSAP